MVCLLVRQFGTANINFSSRTYQISTTHIYIFYEYTLYLFILDLQEVQNCNLNTSDLGLYSGHHLILYLVVPDILFCSPVVSITELYVNCPVSLPIMVCLLRLLPSLMGVKLANVCLGLTGAGSSSYVCTQSLWAILSGDGGTLL